MYGRSPVPRMKMPEAQAAEKTTLLGSLVNRGNPPPVFFSDRLEAERGNVFFQRRLFGG